MAICRNRSIMRDFELHNVELFRVRKTLGDQTEPAAAGKPRIRTDKPIARHTEKAKGSCRSDKPTG